MVLCFAAQQCAFWDFSLLCIVGCIAEAQQVHICKNHMLPFWVGQHHFQIAVGQYGSNNAPQDYVGNYKYAKAALTVFQLLKLDNFDFRLAQCTTKQMMWHQQKLELPQQQRKPNDSEEEEDNAEQLLLQELFLEQPHTMQHCFWVQGTIINWWEWIILQTWDD